MKKILSFFAAMLVAVAANAAVINIDNTTEDALRLALNDASDGDVIVMAAGTYVESNGDYIAFDDKTVTVRAAEGAEVIIQPKVPITVSNGGHAIFENVKIDASHLTDLADWYEHLLYVTDENPNGCTFRGCELYGFNLNKSMFYCNNANKVALMKFEGCYLHDIMKSIIFIENTAGKPMVSVKNCTFANISTNAESYWAGVIDVRATEATLTVDHCTFYNVIPMNTDYSCVSKITLAKGTVSNCIFMLPTAQDGIRAMRGVTATNCITFNYLKDSGTGIHSSVTQNNCVQVDPLFVNAAEGNFTLGENSPALTMNDGEPIGDPRWVPSVAPVEPQMKTIYCKMDKDWWKADGAAVGVYTWDDGGNAKAAWPGERMTPVEGEADLWSVELDINTYHMCIFTRVNGEGDVVDWGAKTTNLTIPTDENDMFTITNDDPSWGDPGCTGAWSKYGEVVPEPKFRIAGSMSEEWAPSIESFEDSYTLHLAAGTHRLKVVTLENAWKGYTDLTEENKAAELFTDQSGNICFVLAAEGDVVVTYTNELYKVEGAFIPAPVQLIGIGGWDAETYAIALTPAEDHLTASVTLNLDEWYYEFKMIVAGAWLGKENAEGLYNLHREWTSVDGLTYEGGNIKLTMDAQDIVPGDYIFTWEYATGKLTVTFPTPAPTGITWELNGGMAYPKSAQSKYNLWCIFEGEYNAYYNLTRAHQEPETAQKVATFANAKMMEIMQDANAGWKWLGDYCLGVAEAQNQTMSSESQWRWGMGAFWSNTAQNVVTNIDFTEAGKDENWLPACQSIALPASVEAEFTLPAAYKEGVEFGGWFDNAEFNGEALTVIPANYAGTLYAKWVSPSTNIENTAAAIKVVKVIENGQMIIIRGNEKFNVQGQVIR